MLVVGAFASLGAYSANIGITNVLPLSFGRFVAGNGTLTISPLGARIATGGVVALQTDPGQAAQFLVTGDPDTTYSISVPADGTVSLTHNSASLPVNVFTTSPAFTGSLSATGSQVLRVGARLDVTAGLVHGAYVGSFPIIVEYN
jgi:adhesin HecA-like repeat protein